MQYVETTEDGYVVRRYDNGVITKTLISVESEAPAEIIPQPTNQEVMDNQMIIMEVLATIYEDMLMKGMV